MNCLLSVSRGAALSFALLTLTAASAHAQEQTEEPAGPAPAAKRNAPDPNEAPPAHTGFQIAVRPGVALPMGSIGKDANGTKLSQSDVFGGQFSTTIDIGGKVIPNLFIGGYLGLNIGGAGGKQSDACDKAEASCAAVSLRIGIEAQYHFIPDGKVNPWLGYGIGYEASALSEKVDNVSVTESVAGPEFGHFMGGVDFRLSKVFGLGPFVDFGVGQYSKVSSDASGSSSSDIPNKALHEWLTLGAKFVFFP